MSLHTTRHQLTTDLLPEPLDYALLEPPDPGQTGPLVLALHGGGGDCSFLDSLVPVFEAQWATGQLAPLTVATPSAQRSFYMDYRDGSQRWESAVLGPFLDALVDRHGAGGHAGTSLLGISMGGMGALRMAFKHPDRFVAVAALEPGIEPVYEFADIDIEDRFWRSGELFEQIYGRPVDQAYWRDNHPVAIAALDPSRLRHSPLAIYLEVGDEDSFGLHRGTEFLHRVLFDEHIAHEYRLVRGADHLGATLPGRFADAVRFLARAINPPPRDDSLGPFHQLIATMRRDAGLS